MNTNHGDETAALPPDAVAALPSALPGWQVEDGRLLVRARRFADFDAAFTFVSAVASCARARDHHPDVRFGWGYATVRLTTHAVRGLTGRDVVLARDIDALDVVRGTDGGPDPTGGAAAPVGTP